KMATASPTEEQLPEVLQCPICLETLRRPKILPCGHRYCTSCLQSHIISKVVNKGVHQACFSCPVCRANTQLSDPTVSVELWAESFPANSSVSAIFDLTGEIHGDNVCDICQKWNIQTTAVSFCKDCKRFMCKICREHHNENQSQLEHDVIDLNCENTSCLTNLSMIEMCPSHRKKNIEFFCSDHSSLCCSTCGFLEHRKCERVITIEDFIKHFNVRAKSKDMEANLRNIKRHVTQMARKVKENAEGIKNEKSAMLEQIRSLRTEINFQVQKREDDLINSLEVNYKTEFLNLQSQEASGHSLMTAVESDLTQKHLVMTHGSETQKVIMLHNIEEHQNRYHKVMSEYRDELRNIKFSLYINKRVKDLIRELNGFGSITVTRTKQSFPSCNIVTPSQLNAEVVSGSSRIPLKNRRAVKVSEFNVNVLGDNAICHISDVLILQGAKHMLVDRANSKIKIYGENYKLQEIMTVQGHPWNACILPDNNIAVTVPNNKTILIIGIVDKMQNIRDIKTRLSCWGIAVFKKRFIIISCHDEDSILILDMTGAEVRTLQPDNYFSDKLICPWYLKVKESETVIYVSYSFGHKLVAYNRLWNKRFTYTNQNMKLPDGIDTDREGNIYLCGYDSYNVQQISADGEFIKTLIIKEDDKLKPRTLRFYRDLERFVVTYCNCNIIEVYDMCD
ncbi:hypothetical protein CHS0354_007385, partial [Potamilus streckersoni]